jgi:glutamyl-tRNA synthetase
VGAAIEAEFRLEDVNTSPAFFDVKKLAAFNGEYIRMLASTSIAERATRGCRPSGTVTVRPRMVPYIQERPKTLADVAPMVDFLYVTSPQIDEASWDKAFEARLRACRCCAT